MHVCETTLCNIQMTLFEHPLYCNIQKSFRVHNTRVKVLFFHLTKFDLVKLAQMRHYMTSDEKTLNTKFDHLSKIYNCYIAHFRI